MFSVADICGIAVRIEENGERFYRQAVPDMTESSCKDLLLWIADEEARHREFFLEMKETLPKKGEDWAGMIGSEILEGAVADHAFSLDDTSVESLMDERVIIQTAIGLEEDSILFYELLLSFITDEETTRRVQSIVSEERGHIEMLNARRALSSAPAARG